MRIIFRERTQTFQTARGARIMISKDMGRTFHLSVRHSDAFQNADRVYYDRATALAAFESYVKRYGGLV